MLIVGFWSSLVTGVRDLYLLPIGWAVVFGNDDNDSRGVGGLRGMTICETCGGRNDEVAYARGMRPD